MLHIGWTIVVQNLVYVAYIATYTYRLLITAPGGFWGSENVSNPRSAGIQAEFNHVCELSLLVLSDSLWPYGL